MSPGPAQTTGMNYPLLEAPDRLDLSAELGKQPSVAGVGVADHTIIDSAPEPPSASSTPRSALPQKYVSFAATYFMSLCVLFFSFYMVVRDTQNTQVALWSSIITSIAAQYIPSPVHATDKR